MLWMSNVAHAQSSTETDGRIKVAVSILPQAYFTERIGGERVDVSVMVGPGQSPETYEPRPKQMAELSQARLYLRIGVAFESIWMKNIGNANPMMQITDTHRGIELIAMTGYNHAGEAEAEHSHARGIMDPHIWLSPRLVKIQAENITDALIALDPAYQVYYRDNLRALINDLDTLDREIVCMLSNLKTRKFMVFHPAWGYFARDYGLQQIPIEIEGKEPSAKAMVRLITEAKDAGIKVIFVQEQFGKQSAEAVARSIEGKVVPIDPLSRDYLSNMKKIAGAFAEGLK